MSVNILLSLNHLEEDVIFPTVKMKELRLRESRSLPKVYSGQQHGILLLVPYHVAV